MKMLKQIWFNLIIAVVLVWAPCCNSNYSHEEKSEKGNYNENLEEKGIKIKPEIPLINLSNDSNRIALSSEIVKIIEIGDSIPINEVQLSNVLISDHSQILIDRVIDTITEFHLSKLGLRDQINRIYGEPFRGEKKSNEKWTSLTFNQIYAVGEEKYTKGCEFSFFIPHKKIEWIIVADNQLLVFIKRGNQKKIPEDIDVEYFEFDPDFSIRTFGYSYLNVSLEEYGILDLLTFLAQDFKKFKMKYKKT